MCLQCVSVVHGRVEVYREKGKETKKNGGGNGRSSTRQNKS